MGLAISRFFAGAKRVGYSHRPITRELALSSGTIDICFASAAESVAEADLVVLASPIGTFVDLFEQIAPVLPAGCIVTDVGSTKVLPTRWARRLLPRSVEYIGSHPMAGSEQRGVDFARADLFDGANCIITPTAGSSPKAVRFLSEFWSLLGMRISRMTPARHDRVLSRISHLPHILAAALVNCSDPQQTLLCGKGFFDTTRIASGAPSVWLDIFMTNAANVDSAIDKLIDQLQVIQVALRDGNGGKLNKLLEQARVRRNKLVEEKIKRGELPS